jgi:hypothetical protein
MRAQIEHALGQLLGDTLVASVRDTRQHAGIRKQPQSLLCEDRSPYEGVLPLSRPAIEGLLIRSRGLLGRGATGNASDEQQHDETEGSGHDPSRTGMAAT